MLDDGTVIQVVMVVRLFTVSDTGTVIKLVMVVGLCTVSDTALPSDLPHLLQSLFFFYIECTHEMNYLIYSYFSKCHTVTGVSQIFA